MRLPFLCILGLHLDPEGLHKIREKAPDTRSLQSQYARGAAGAGTSLPPHPRSPAGRRTGAPPRPAPPAGVLRPLPGGAGRRRRREAGLVGPPRGTRSGVARRKDARGGAAVGEGSPSCPDSHSPPRSPHGPGSAAVLAPASTERVSSRCSTSSQGARSCGEVGASGGSTASRAERLGRMGQSLSLPRRTPHTRPRPAPLSHGS